MNKEFVPYQESLELKELGFDEPCFRWYDERWGDDLQQDKYNTNKDLYMTDLDCSAPLYQQAFRWFREKYGLASQFNYYHVPKWTYSILEFTDIKITPNQIVSEYSKERAYEEAELACLRKLIQIVKNK